MRDGWADLQEAIGAIRGGGIAIVVTSAAGEDEGNLVMAADRATAASINFMVVHGRGLVSVAMPESRLWALDIPPIPQRGTGSVFAAFHTSVDLLVGTTTGVSAADRAVTVRALADPGSAPSDFARPGHVFPVACADQGPVEEEGPSEAAVELVRRSGRAPAAAICEILSEDGRTARLPELLELGDRHGLPVISIANLVGRPRSVAG